MRINQVAISAMAGCLAILFTVSVSANQQVIYPTAAMPRVDMHTHMDAKPQYDKAIAAMDKWGGTITISLTGLFWVKDNNGSNACPASVRQIPTNDMVYVKEKYNDRILFVPGAFTIPRVGIWWGIDEIKTFKEQGFVGLKLWPHGKMLSSKIPLIHEQLAEAGRQGMPLIGYHTGDPGNAKSNNAAFPKFEDDTIEVASKHPQTTFIFAHGLFMLENDEGLDKLAGIFDKYPNVFVDLSYVHNMRQEAHYTVSKARDFYIKYKDRILFGTDVFGGGAPGERFLEERKLLETAEVTSGMNRGPKLQGFNLPVDVLNHIYYWNAARLIPRVKTVLEAQGFKIGYELGDFTFDRLPPDVTVNTLTLNGKAADLTGTLGGVTESLVVEIAGKKYEGVDNRDGTWKLPGEKLAGLPPGSYDVKVTAQNALGLVRNDSSLNELIVLSKPGVAPSPVAETLPEEILFCERNPGRDYSRHYYANFGYDCGNENYWLYGADGGRLAIYSPKTDSVRTLLEDASGAFRDPQIHDDGKRVLFSYRKGGTHHYNLYEMNLDGTGLRQITRGDWDDVEATYLPDGGIAFCSTRCKRYVLCWLAPVAVLFRCNPDGSGLRQLSSNTVTENTPCVLPDGRILYTRWEYVNRDAVSFHHLWTMNPDGTGAMVYYGNMHPGGVFIDAQPIEGTDKVVFIASGYHGQLEHAGKVTVLSLRKGPDDRTQAKPITGDGFRDPYPLSEHVFLAARGEEIVTVTAEGVVKTRWKAKAMVHEPRPIKSRPRPPVIPSRVDLSKTTGTLVLTDVYVGRNMSGIKPGSIKKLLVMEDLPKPVNFHGGGTTPLAHGGSWTFKRILGTVPVEADGSANFEIPACRSIYFAALDANDLCLKQMRSFLTVQPGEQVSCIGCHENRTVTAQAYPGVRLASQRAPSTIQPFVGIPEILDFPRDIQPILNRYCIRCHDNENREGGLVLSGDRGPTYSLAYYNLLLHRQIKDHAGLKWEGIQNIGGRPGGNDAPYSAFSYASPLMKHLEESHCDAELSAVERTTIRLWLDSATPYAGTAAAFGTGQIGGWWRNNEPLREMADAWPTTGPAKEAMQRRCTTCHEGRLPRFVTDRTTNDPYNDFEGWERPVSRFSRHTIFNLTHPDQALALLVPLAKSAGGFAEGPLPKTAPVPSDLSRTPKPVVHGVVFESKGDPDYQALLAHLQAARNRLNEIKRFDMPGFKPGVAYSREMKRYGILPASFDPEKEKVDTYALDRQYWQQFWWEPVRRAD